MVTSSRGAAQTDVSQMKVVKVNISCRSRDSRDSSYSNEVLEITRGFTLKRHDSQATRVCFKPWVTLDDCAEISHGSGKVHLPGAPASCTLALGAEAAVLSIRTQWPALTSVLGENNGSLWTSGLPPVWAWIDGLLVSAVRKDRRPSTRVSTRDYRTVNQWFHVIRSPPEWG